MKGAKVQPAVRATGAKSNILKPILHITTSLLADCILDGTLRMPLECYFCWYQIPAGQGQVEQQSELYKMKEV